MTYPKLSFLLPLLAIPIIYLPVHEQENASKFMSIEEVEHLKNSTIVPVQGFEIEYATETRELDYTIEHTNTMSADEDPEGPTLIVRPHSGIIRGACMDPYDQGGDYTVVYAYKKGAFNPGTMTYGQSIPDLLKGSVSHALVQDDESYTLTSLKDGEYELRFIRYDDTDGDGTAEPVGYLELELIASLDLLGLTIDSEANLSMDVTIIGASAF